MYCNESGGELHVSVLYCRCIPRLTRCLSHFRLCIWAEGWYRQQSKRRGHGLNTRGEASPPNHKHTPRLLWTKPSVWDRGRINEHCSCLAGHTEDESATSDIGSRGHVADYRRRNGRAQEVLNTVKPWPTSLTPTELWGTTSKRATLLKDYNWVE